MSPWRVGLVHGLIAGLVGSHLYEILFGGERWPFSRYSMFSGVARDTFVSTLRLVGVTAQNPAREVPWVGDAEIWPFDQVRLRGILRNMASTAGGEARLDAALTDLLERYEARRRAGQLAGPELQALRLYRLQWQLEPWARNRERPDQRTLLCERPRSLA